MEFNNGTLRENGKARIRLSGRLQLASVPPQLWAIARGKDAAFMPCDPLLYAADLLLQRFDQGNPSLRQPAERPGSLIEIVERILHRVHFFEAPETGP